MAPRRAGRANRFPEGSTSLRKLEAGLSAGANMGPFIRPEEPTLEIVPYPELLGVIPKIVAGITKAIL